MSELATTSENKFDWTRLGMDPKSAERMLTFESSVGLTLLTQMAVTRGGSMIAYAIAHARLEYVTRKLLEIEEKGVKTHETEQGPMMDPEYQMYHKQQMELMEKIAKFDKIATGTAKDRVSIEAKMREMAAAAAAKSGPKKVLATTDEEIEAVEREREKKEHHQTT